MILELVLVILIQQLFRLLYFNLYKKKNISISNCRPFIKRNNSDTLFLKSNSTTKEDINPFNYLSNFIQIYTTKYGKDLLLAGTNYSDLREYDIINLDSKAYVVNGHQIQILKEMIKFNKDNKKELFFFNY